MDVATFTTLAKIKSGEISCNTPVLALAKIFSREIFPLYGILNYAYVHVHVAFISSRHEKFIREPSSILSYLKVDSG